MTSPTYFTVSADYRSVVADALTDSDYDPEIASVSAVVTFTPMLASGDVILATNASPRPTGYVPVPIAAMIDPADGRLKLRTATDDGGTGFDFAPVRLLADTGLLELAEPLFYTVTFTQVLFNGRSGNLTSFTFQAPTSDVELNLIEVSRTPGQPASGITKIAPGAVRLDGGNAVFSFGGVDIPDPLELVINAVSESTDITDSTAIGRSVLTAASAAAARTAIGMSAVGQSVATASSQLDARSAVGEDHRSDLATSFVGKADGAPPATGDDGVAVTIVTIPPVIKDELLQSPDLTGTPTTRATYWNQPLNGGKRIGATFKLSPGTSGGLVSVGLIFWEYPIPTPYQVPNSPLHLVANTVGWELAIFSGGTNPSTTATFTSIGSGTFGTPLATDWNPAVAGSGTLHRMEALIVDSTAIIFLPDGSVASVTDSRIASIPATVACHEFYMGSSTAGRLAFQDIWSSTSSDLPIGAVDLSSTQRISNKTFTSTTLTSPRVGTSILDANGNTSALVSATASAVNHLQFYNAATGVSPILLAAGSDTNVTLGLRGKGNGQVLVTDGYGRNVIGFGLGSASAVNYWNLYNSATGADIALYANGSDTNIGINVVPKGSGTLKSKGTAVLLSGGALGTPASGTLVNCTFPTLNQNTTGSAASLTTARKINGTSFDGTADVTVGSDLPRTQLRVATDRQSAVSGSNHTIYQRVIGSGSISKIGLWVKASSGNISVSVYSNSGVGSAALPASRQATSGSIACPAIGYAEISLGATVAVKDGDWMAISADNVTAAFACPLAGAGAFNDWGKGIQCAQASAHPSPSTPSSLSATVGYDIGLKGIA